jgi:hypothetical protein
MTNVIIQAELVKARDSRFILASVQLKQHSRNESCKSSNLFVSNKLWDLGSFFCCILPFCCLLYLLVLALGQIFLRRAGGLVVSQQMDFRLSELSKVMRCKHELFVE